MDIEVRQLMLIDMGIGISTVARVDGVRGKGKDGRKKKLTTMGRSCSAGRSMALGL